MVSNLTKNKTRYVDLTKKNKLTSQIECHHANTPQIQHSQGIVQLD